jgi:hypothetical protein
MGIKVYKYRITESGTVPVDRTCANCGYNWTAKLIVSAEGEADSTLQGDPDAIRKAKENALIKLESQKLRKKLDINEQVMCPVCNHFDIKAMAKHFSKGYAEGLLSKFRKEEWKDFAVSLGASFLAPVALGVAIQLVLYVINTAEKADDWFWLGWVIVPGGISLGMGYLALNRWKILIHSVKARRKVEHMLSDSSEDELLRLVIKCYQDNGNSLGSGDSWIVVLSSEIDKR